MFLAARRAGAPSSALALAHENLRGGVVRPVSADGDRNRGLAVGSLEGRPRRGLRYGDWAVGRRLKALIMTDRRSTSDCRY